jgi:single-strand DNA-binding protein
MNVWTFTGRLGADGELRTTQTGEKVLGFRVANDIGFGDHKKTQWIDCALWGKRAEALAPHLTRGKSVVISGEVTLREYEKRDGTRGAGLSVRVSEIDLAGGERRDSDASAAGDRRSAGGGGGGQGGYGDKPPRGRDDDLDDEIPFARSDVGMEAGARFGKDRPV